MTHPIIIIGAGAAGIAAARMLAAQGLPYLVLEATGQTGGRVRPRKTSRDLIWDEGAHWLHDIEGPHELYGFAQAFGWAEPPSNGQSYLITKSGEWVIADSFWSETAQFLMDLSDEEPDHSLDVDFPKNTVFWKHFMQTNSGFDPEQISRRDHALSRYGVDTIIKPSYGKLIQTLANDLNVKLNSPVHKIQYNSTKAIVYTEAHAFEAAAVILTVSVGVLKAGSIAFDPPLPASKSDAISKINMGLAARVGLITTQIIPEWSDAYLLVELDNTVVDVEVFPFSQPVITCYFAGSQTSEYEAQNHLLPLSLEAVQRTGLSVDIIETFVSNWTHDPYFYGAYSGVEIGHTNKRPILAAPHPPIFFAGEATRVDDFATASGAWDTGVRAARECFGFLTRSKA